MERASGSVLRRNQLACNHHEIGLVCGVNTSCGRDWRMGFAEEGGGNFKHWFPSVSAPAGAHPPFRWQDAIGLGWSGLSRSKCNATYQCSPFLHTAQRAIPVLVCQLAGRVRS